jgi:anthranilate phosphoribosyltransferase
MRDDESSMSLVSYLHQVSAHENLSAQQAHDAMTLLLAGGVPDALVAALLVALRMKGETASEVAGFARAMREHMVTVDAGPDVAEIVGTGGDASGTFNISTVASLVLAGAGVRVAKHGNRAISSRAGSADVLEALGVRIAMTPGEAARAVRESGLGFLFAPNLHPAMKNVQPVRRELKMRTVFNLLGPLTNPAKAQTQVIGAPSVEFAEVMADALNLLGTGHSLVVHGQDGVDEVSLSGPTHVFEVRAGRVEKCGWTPEDFGVARSPVEALAGGDVAENARITLDILRGVSGPRRDVVLINAAAGLLAAGRAADPRSARAMAEESIDSGRALGVLEKLQREFPAQ